MCIKISEGYKIESFVVDGGCGGRGGGGGCVA